MARAAAAAAPITTTTTTTTTIATAMQTSNSFANLPSQAPQGALSGTRSTLDIGGPVMPGPRRPRCCDICGAAYQSGGRCDLSPICPRGWGRRRDLPPDAHQRWHEFLRIVRAVLNVLWYLWDFSGHRPQIFDLLWRRLGGQL